MSYTDADTGTAIQAVRHDGWTRERQLDFLEALAAHGHIGRAATSVGLSASSVYRLRARDAAFARAWHSASAMAYYKLRDVAMDRIDFSETTSHLYHGEVVATRTRYSDRLLVAMLDHLKPVAIAAGAARVIDPGHAYAAAIAAYVTAIATGDDPEVPEAQGDGTPRRPMSRAEFIAAIRMRPRFDENGERITTDPNETAAEEENDFPSRA